MLWLCYPSRASNFDPFGSESRLWIVTGLFYRRQSDNDCGANHPDKGRESDSARGPDANELDEDGDAGALDWSALAGPGLDNIVLGEPINDLLGVLRPDPPCHRRPVLVQHQGRDSLGRVMRGHLGTGIDVGQYPREAALRIAD